MAEIDIKNLSKVIADVPAEAENSPELRRPKIIEIKLARLIAVQCLYHFEITGSVDSTLKLASDMVESWKENKYFKFPGHRVCRDYLRNILKITIDNLDKIDKDISSYLEETWRLDRIPKVVLAILRVAAAEIYRKELDFAIIIDEYLNIADYMNHEGEKGFVNSILDQIAKQYI